MLGYRKHNSGSDDCIGEKLTIIKYRCFCAYAVLIYICLCVNIFHT